MTLGSQVVLSAVWNPVLQLINHCMTKKISMKGIFSSLTEMEGETICPFEDICFAISVVAGSPNDFQSKDGIA